MSDSLSDLVCVSVNVMDLVLRFIPWEKLLQLKQNDIKVHTFLVYVLFKCDFTKSGLTFNYLPFSVHLLMSLCAL